MSKYYGKKILFLTIFVTIICIYLTRPAVLFPVQTFTPEFSDPLLEKWRWKSFPELNGKGLQCICQSTDGVMWFGTRNGVFRYDGLKWTHYSSEDGLISERIREIISTKSGRIYIASDKGIGVFIEGAWKNIIPNNHKLKWSVMSLCETSDNNIWAGTNWGALKISDMDIVLYTSNDVASALEILMPELSIVTIPNHATSATEWGDNVGFVGNNGIIWNIYPGSSADKADINVGDQIISIDGKLTSNIGYFKGAVDKVFNIMMFSKEYQDYTEVKLLCEKLNGKYHEFQVNDVFQDDSGSLWFGLTSGEIVCFRTSETGAQSWQLYDENDGLDQGHMPRLAQTHDGKIWAVNSEKLKGINQFNGEEWHSIQLSDIGGDNHGYSILTLCDGTLIIGGHNGFLHTYKEGKWTVYNSPLIPTPSKERIVDLYQSASGDLWIAVFGKQAYRMENINTKWRTYEGLHFQCELSDGELWFITRDSAAVCFDKSEWLRYDFTDSLMNAPKRLFSTKDGELWAAGSHKNIAAIARFNKGFWKLYLFPELSMSIYPSSIFESSDGSVWFGSDVPYDSETHGTKGGLLRFKNGNWKHYTPPDVPQTVNGIAETTDGTIWCGSIRGLFRFNGTTWIKSLQPGKLNEISFIDALCSTREGNLWIGHRKYGAFYFDNKKWSCYDINDGLSDNSVFSITQTKDGTIWATTSSGICRFDGKNWANPALPNGLDGQEIIQSNDGAIWINQGRIKYTERGLSTTQYRPDKNAPNTKIITLTDKVSQPGNTSFAWEGSDLWENTPHNMLQYSWRLDGGSWSPYSFSLNRTFLELKSGKHSFEVKARDIDFNQDPTPARINFKVIPPVWKQPLFLLLISILLGIILFQAVKIVIRDKKLIRANETLQTMSEIKQRFFTNISHEFRTPLTLILGPLDQIIGNGKVKNEIWIKEQCRIMKQNAKRLLFLVNELLELRKVEENRLKIENSWGDLIKYARNIAYYFKEHANVHNIDYKFETNVPSLECWFDAKKVDKILYNLLSNAFKYTPDYGLIKIKCTKVNDPDGQDYIEFQVEDNGTGISDDKIDYIFDRFYQAEDLITRKHEGTGIGLSLTKDLVEFLGGTIKVESEIDKGSVFTIKLPLDQQPNDEIVNNTITVKAYTEINRLQLPNNEKIININNDKPIILIIEDNENIIRYISGELDSYYNIFSASNGVQGLQKAIELVPDLIISDIMMPEMNGIEFCNAVKTDERTSHIPVILLTARSSEESELEGFKIGADDYVIKPFNINTLTARVNNLINSRKQLREQFSRHIYVEPSKITITSYDENFLKRAIKLVEDHIDDPEFGVETFSKLIGMSRVNLYRKIKSLTDQTVSEFIRTIRLKRSVQLLEQSGLTITEIAFEVGFNDLSTYTRAFRKLFGQSPSEYAKNNL